MGDLLEVCISTRRYWKLYNALGWLVDHRRVCHEQVSGADHGAADFCRRATGRTTSPALATIVGGRSGPLAVSVG